MVKASPFHWQDYFDAAFAEVKAKFDAIYPDKKVDELPPSVIGMKNFVHSLPCPVKVLEIRVDLEKHNHIKDKVCQLIGYDFSKLGDSFVAYCGIQDADDTGGLNRFFVEEFGFLPSEGVAKDFCQDLTTISYYDEDHPEILFQFPHYDIRDKSDQYAHDFLELMSWVPLSSETKQRFWKEEVDYNALYDLSKDPILPMPKVVEKDSTFNAFVKLSGGEATGITIEDLQEHIADIQLIPQVPEAVKRVFQTAKELYVFGYFRYVFFTVSAHYSYLALESAIKHRYSISLGDKAVLSNYKGQYHEIKPPSWERIDEFCRQRSKEGWSRSKTSVNGRPFPSTMPRLLDWLVDNGLLRKWERRQFEAGIYLRNSLSHLEFPSIHAPSTQTLNITARQINRLFSTLTAKKSN